MVFLIFISLLHFSIAATNYYYDSSGKLTYYETDAGAKVVYSYDNFGNLLEVRRVDGLDTAPQISSVMPSSIPQKTLSSIALTGANLDDVTLSPINNTYNWLIKNVSKTDTEINFDLNPLDAPAGNYEFVVQNNLAEQAIFNLNVDPIALIPELTVTPYPFGLSDSGSSLFLIRSNVAVASDTTVTMSLSNDAASLASDHAIILAGNKEVTASISGNHTGIVYLSLVADGYESVTVPIYVSPEFSGINTATGALVGVQVADEDQATLLDTTGFSSLVGVTKGAIATAKTPGSISVGVTKRVSIEGIGLDDVSNISISPDTNISISNISHTSELLTFDLTVSADALLGNREIQLTDSNDEVIPFAQKTDALIKITTEQPTILGISPNIIEIGAAAKEIYIVGENLQSVDNISINDVNTSFSITSQDVAGKWIVANAYAGFQAEVGGYSLIASQGTDNASSSELSAGNTISLVESIVNTYDPIVAPLVGITVGSDISSSYDTHLYSNITGISVGDLITSRNKSVITQNESIEVTLYGSGLDHASDVYFDTSSGLEISDWTASQDGSSLTFTVYADTGSTTLGDYYLHVDTVDGALAFAAADLAKFTLVSGFPVIKGLSPNIIYAGETTKVVLIGKNLQNLVNVISTPSVQISIDDISFNGTTAELSVYAPLDLAGHNTILKVETMAGISQENNSAVNTLNIVDPSADLRADIYTNLVGVDVGVGSSTSFDTTLLSNLVGVYREDDEQVLSREVDLLTDTTGVVVGQYILSSTQTTWAIGGETTVTLSGVNIPDLVSLQLTNESGELVSAEINITSQDADHITATISSEGLSFGWYRLDAYNKLDEKISNTSGAIYLAESSPEIDSITPILGYKDSVVELVIRGNNLGKVKSINLIGNDNDVALGNIKSVSGDEDMLILDLYIMPTATTGTYIIEVNTLGGSSGVEALPANTFTIYDN